MFYWCCTQCPHPCSRSLPTHSSARDSWTFTGKSGSRSWCTQAFVCALQESVSQSCVSSGSSTVGSMAISFKRAYAIPRSAVPRALSLQQSTVDPCLHRRHSNIVLAQSLWGLWVWWAQGLFEPSECLWKLWGLILNTISPVLPSCSGFSFALGNGISFSGGIQHSPVDSCLAASCNFGVLAGGNECTSYYPAVCHFVSYFVLVMNISRLQKIK